MEDMFTRFFDDLVGRMTGPMKFRMVMQPFMAVLFAIRDGRKDAFAGQVPYFWSILSNPEHRRDLLRSGWKSVGKVFILAIVLDAVYQFKVLRTFHVVEAMVVAVLLALVPYLLVRGPANRLTPRKGK